ncbi:MAG: hypothetical protein V3V04_08455 [Rhizobiaceae bacterium]
MNLENTPGAGFLGRRSMLRFILPDPVVDLVQDDALADEIRGHQVLAIKRMTPIMLLANVISILSSIYILNGVVNPNLLIGWSLFAAVITFGGMAGIRFRWKIKSEAYPRKNTFNIVKSSVLLALIWAILPLLFFAEAPTSEKVFIASVTSGMMGGGTIALNIVPVAARAFAGQSAWGQWVLYSSRSIQLCLG